jgi:predicted peptidase
MLPKPILRMVFISLVLGCNAQEPKKETATTETSAQLNDDKPKNFAKAEIIKKIDCIADASQSYALYLPKDYNAETKKGAIFFFDPHGDGALPLEKYTSLAESLNFIFVGSNNSKNGNDWPTSQNVCNALFSDCQKRLNIDAQQIYVVGFSGGAKVACFALSQFGFIAGALAQSAMLPIQTNNIQSKKSIVGMAGTSDMNYTDVVNGMDALPENIFTKSYNRRN